MPLVFNTACERGATKKPGVAKGGMKSPDRPALNDVRGRPEAGRRPQEKAARRTGRLEGDNWKSDAIRRSELTGSS